MTSTTPTQSSTPGQHAADAASGAVSTAKEQAASVVDTSKAEVRSVADDARSHAREVLAQSRDQLRSQSEEQLRNLAETLADIGRQLSCMAEGQPQSGMVLDATNGLADAVGQVGERLERDGLDGALRDVTQFARRRPGVFLLASLASGLLVGRVLRSSDRHALVDAAKAEASTDGESVNNGAAGGANPSGTSELGFAGGQ